MLKVLGRSICQSWRYMEGATTDRPTECAERLRLASAESLEMTHRAALGQFFTPSPVARLVASKLSSCCPPRVRLLDPGAGVGSLTAAAVEHYASLGVKELEVVAWEIDTALHPALGATLDQSVRWAADQGLRVSWNIRGGNYIEAVAKSLAGGSGAEVKQFDAIIMNPPYRKVNCDATERLALQQLGLPITNLYTAFLALGAVQLSPNGVLAAITPRSFASGLYSAPFRHFFFKRVGIEQLHLFESRTSVFADAAVLQENVIFSVRRNMKPQQVRLSFSYGIEDAPRVREAFAEEILHPDDPHLFLRIPSEDQDEQIANAMVSLPSTLTDLDISVSTGRVVEFRTREHLRIAPDLDTAPLVRPNHLKNNKVCWPDTSRRGKPNALVVNPVSEKLLLPNEIYVLVKRMTAKEESRRVRAAVSDPIAVSGRHVAFENHLNVFHRSHEGLPNDLAHGLAAYLNSSFVDRYVRQFNGHTQINATDLRHLRYPSNEHLETLGAAVLRNPPATQEALDEAVNVVLRDSVAEDALQAAA